MREWKRDLLLFIINKTNLQLIKQNYLKANIKLCNEKVNIIYLEELQ